MKESQSESEDLISPKKKWISRILWLCAFLLVSITGVLAKDEFGKTTNQIIKTPDIRVESKKSILESSSSNVSENLKELPGFKGSEFTANSLIRKSSLITIIPSRSRREITEYEVLLGDSVFGIAGKYGLRPESILWANYDLLMDNPHSLYAGMVLLIPPIDGVLYQWEEGDSIESVANSFSGNIQDIINWTANELDLVNPIVPPGFIIMIPAGEREFQQWIIPTIPRGAAGVSQGLYGSGACAGGYEGGNYGSGAFIWPTVNRSLSGNDYWSGHLAIDIGSAPGEVISASDSGVVVFSGWATGGYGNIVVIDHGNGYQSLYAHLNDARAICGASVTAGQMIGLGGSTGNSSGPHLHFEIRYLGGFVNPWFVLPPP